MPSRIRFRDYSSVTRFVGIARVATSSCLGVICTGFWLKTLFKLKEGDSTEMAFPSLALATLDITDPFEFGTFIDKIVLLMPPAA